MSRTLFGKACSQFVPRSLTTAASTAGVLPACSMPATLADMRRNVARCATSRPMPSDSFSPGCGPATRTNSVNAVIVSSQRSGPLRS